MTNQLTVASILVVVALAVSCGEQKQSTPPPPKVTVATPITRDVQTTAEFTGTTQASNAAEIRARVSGALVQMHFDPTSFVNQGDVLFTIEPGPYQAARDAAFAQLQSAKAELAYAESELRRIEAAIKDNAVSELALDEARAQRDQAEASVLVSQADLDKAELNLGYTRVRSPIQGQVGRNLVDVGNLVGAKEPTLLTTVNKIDPIYVYFNAPERLVLRFPERIIERAGQDEDDSNRIRVQVKLASEDEFRHEGYIDYIDNKVDVSTGTIELRAVFENDDLVLFPGLFVRIRLFVGQAFSSILVDERALANDIGGKHLLIVGDDNVVEQRYVKLGELQDDAMIVVEDGLEGNERYIVNGLLRARPGKPVTPMTGEEVGAAEGAKK